METRIDNIKMKYLADNSYNVNASIAKDCIVIFGNMYGKNFIRSFKLGEEAKVGSYNLIYTERIVKITNKRITFENSFLKYKTYVKSLNLSEFINNNYDYDSKRIREHNIDTYQYI